MISGTIAFINIFTGNVRAYLPYTGHQNQRLIIRNFGKKYDMRQYWIHITPDTTEGITPTGKNMRITHKEHCDPQTISWKRPKAKYDNRTFI